MALLFEPLAEEHGKEVIDIYNYYIDNSFAAYFEERLPESFFARILEVTKGYPAKAIRDGGSGKIVGFCFLRAYHPLPAFRRTAEITYFIAKDAVGKGTGKEALKLLEKEAKDMGIEHILASISSFNDQSLGFHKRNGFTERGRFTDIGRKWGKSFSVVWMQKDI
jgi:phosphinothricin acetyltransferase